MCNLRRYAKSTHNVALGANSGGAKKVAEKVASGSNTFMEGVDQKFTEFFAAAEPHQTTILSSLGGGLYHSNAAVDP